MAYHNKYINDLLKHVLTFCDISYGVLRCKRVRVHVGKALPAACAVMLMLDYVLAKSIGRAEARRAWSCSCPRNRAA